MSDLFDNAVILPTRILAVVATFLLVAMMLVTVSDVTLRAVFHGAIDNAQLMTSHWFLSGVIFLPLAYIAVLDRHISIEVVEGLVARIAVPLILMRPVPFRML